MAFQTQTCPENEIQKSQLTMNLKALREIQEKIAWPTNTNDLPVVSWESCESLKWILACLALLTINPVREQSLTRPLIVIAGFIHDVSRFIDQHPGGEELLVNMVGKDATTAFFGGVYLHSNAAHNVSLLARLNFDTESDVTLLNSYSR
jgi:stearoyl-CoA desaturase (delta-9 desaturase)